MIDEFLKNVAGSNLQYCDRFLTYKSGKWMVYKILYPSGEMVFSKEYADDSVGLNKALYHLYWFANE